MRWSFKIASIAGIDLRVHATFFLILVIGAVHWLGFGVSGMLFGMGLMMLLFLCVTLHEFGHAIVAKRLGIAVREIVLLPIGGVAMLSRNPDRPMQELLIAVAGPAVNVVIALVLGLYMSSGSIIGLDPAVLAQLNQAGPSFQTLLLWLLTANVMLVLFNMIPAFPLDGGRVFRALLGFLMSWGKATDIATGTGQVLSAGLGLLAILSGNMLLAIIAVIIFMAAGSTRADERARAVLSSRRVGDAYNRYALYLDETDRVSRVIDYLLTSYQPDFAVVRKGELLGAVTREQALASLARGNEDELVTQVMSRDIPHVRASQMLEQVRQTMEERSTRLAAVYDGETYLGLISAEDLAEAMIVIGHMKRRRAMARQPEPIPGGQPEPA